MVEKKEKKGYIDEMKIKKTRRDLKIGKVRDDVKTLYRH